MGHPGESQLLVTTMSLPSAEEQISFLQQIQRLFSEGEFSATYKFALILALAELAIERGDDSGEALELSMATVAEKFAELYWRQMAPYQGDQAAAAELLHQNQGKRAAITAPLQKIYAACGGQLALAKTHQDWPSCLKNIARTVRDMPMQHLQVLGGVQQPFLYDYPSSPRSIRLKPGVVFNLRRYQGLVQQLAKSGWVTHVRNNRLNHPIIGKHDDLEVFMFGAERSPLREVAKILAPLQGNRCFYCQERISEQAEVDHFIAWSRYPRDLAHNFVLAHRGCNNDKRELLAGLPHLEKWLRRLELHGNEIGEHLSELGFVVDSNASRQVAYWAYEQGLNSQSQSWLAKGITEPLHHRCISLF
ncbi:HNH endonuclease [Chitinilyticum aquatile]|uniref:HNH endonuclease n=1 Tax=Chitinilyticum aquatile TaxID=362520 RepID=UPI000414AB51|nr:HNH endonuclease [Chitinilyticum aquatile]